MEKFLALVLAGACSAAAAQTPANNPMPDGSRDTYIGLGVATAPVYEGSGQRRVRALPVMQAAWSNGVFIAGLSAGMHLSSQPSLEYGPLVAIQPRRSESGLGGDAGLVVDGSDWNIIPDPGFISPFRDGKGDGNLLTGMDVQRARLLAGGFLNYYLTPQLRLTNSLLFGSGNDGNGAQWKIGVQHVNTRLAPNHFLSVGVGTTLVNQRHNQAYFGVSEIESILGVNPQYTAEGGLKDVHMNARWNWAFNPSWLLTTGVQPSRLRGSAAASPLTERPTNLTVSTAIAYRF